MGFFPVSIYDSFVCAQLSRGLSSCAHLSGHREASEAEFIMAANCQIGQCKFCLNLLFVLFVYISLTSKCSVT